MPKKLLNNKRRNLENQALTFSWRFQSKGRRILPEILVCQDGIEFLTDLTLAPSDFLRPHEYHEENVFDSGDSPYCEMP